jgi:ankyrin repeat protein
MKRITPFVAVLLLLSFTGCGRPQEESEPVTGESEPAAAPVSQEALMEAALQGDMGTIRRALDQKHEVNARDPAARTALMYAAFNGHADAVRLLLAAGADVNAQDQIGSSALMYAASGPSAETVRILIDAGAEIDMIDSNEHFTALMWAAAEGQAENIKLLLEHGADITLQDVDGDTAESFAAQKGHTVIVQILQDAAAAETEVK